MPAYVAVMMFVWPLVRTVSGLPLNGLIALATLLPMLYVIAPMAWRIRHSDELEQRTHLIALGAATTVGGALSLAGGFLVSARVLMLDGSILLRVFPLIMASYRITRGSVAKQYGDGSDCDAEDAMALLWRVAIPVIDVLLIALRAYLKRDAFRAGMLAGLAAIFDVIALASGVIHWRRLSAEQRASGNVH